MFFGKISAGLDPDLEHISCIMGCYHFAGINRYRGNKAMADIEIGDNAADCFWMSPPKISAVNWLNYPLTANLSILAHL